MSRLRRIVDAGALCALAHGLRFRREREPASLRIEKWRRARGLPKQAAAYRSNGVRFAAGCVVLNSLPELNDLALPGPW
jgi:hypothetical protein